MHLCVAMAREIVKQRQCYFEMLLTFLVFMVPLQQIDMLVMLSACV